MAVNMPAAEVKITPALVSDLLREQRPDLAHLEIRELAHGWDNVSMRVGNELVARLPRREMAVPLVGNEATWLPRMVEKLPLAIPVPVFVGTPGQGYPWPWTLVPWIPGERMADAGQIDIEACARDLGEFLHALHERAPQDAPPNLFRGVPLINRDEATRERIAQLEGAVDTAKAISIWDEAVATPEFDGPALWLHGDLHPANLLTLEGRLSGVIDFGDITAGDPATDLAVAWTVFPEDARAIFIEAYGIVDHATWMRARGWALSLATAYLAHSANSPTMSRIGSKTMARLT